MFCPALYCISEDLGLLSLDAFYGERMVYKQTNKQTNRQTNKKIYIERQLSFVVISSYFVIQIKEIVRYICKYLSGLWYC
jgi:hypothetical protein